MQVELTEGDEVLDTYVDSYNLVTVMLSDLSEISSRVQAKILQFDFSSNQSRYRKVQVYFSDSAEVTAGTLTGSDAGYFGGTSKDLGYYNTRESSCNIGAAIYKYPQFY